MTASVVSSIVGAITTGVLTLIAFQIRRMAHNVGTWRREHFWLMRQTAINESQIKKIMQHLEMADEGK